MSKKMMKDKMGMMGMPMMKEKGGKMPMNHFEMNEGQLGPTSEMKYCSEMGNPKELDKNCKGLADYVKKHKMKY